MDNKIFRYSSVKGSAIPMHSHHYHDLCEIYYMVSGECIYYINDVRYEISEGDVVFIPEGVIHKTDYGKRKSFTVPDTVQKLTYEYINGNGELIIDEGWFKTS